MIILVVGGYVLNESRTKHKLTPLPFSHFSYILVLEKV